MMNKDFFSFTNWSKSLNEKQSFFRNSSIRDQSINKTWLLVKLDFFESQSLDNFKSELVYCWFTKCSITNQIHFSVGNTPWVCTCTWLGFYQTIMTCVMKSVSTLFSAALRVVSITLMQSKIILLIAWATISYFLPIQVWFLSRTVGSFKNLQCPGL